MTLLEWTEKNIESLEQLHAQLLQTNSVAEYLKVEGALEVLNIIRNKFDEQDNQSTGETQAAEA